MTRNERGTVSYEEMVRDPELVERLHYRAERAGWSEGARALAEALGVLRQALAGRAHALLRRAGALLAPRAEGRGCG
jgi:hypothetical protein